MSAPRMYNNPLEGIIAEAMSAISALHMYPKPIPRLPNDEDQGYLSDTDEWCRHAVEHLNAVIDHALNAKYLKGGY